MIENDWIEAQMFVECCSSANSPAYYLLCIITIARLSTVHNNKFNNNDNDNDNDDDDDNDDERERE